MAIFTFADFLVFAGATDVSEDMYSTVAKGVISYIKQQYGIYPEVETVALKVFLDSGQTSIIPKAYPIHNVYRLWYDSDLIDDSTYSYYGEDILLDTALVDIRKPLTLELDMGFGDIGIPDDLKLAIYRHILSVYYAIDKHTDNVDKTLNATGNTTYFTNDVVPIASKQTYMFYAGFTLLSL